MHLLLVVLCKIHNRHSLNWHFPRQELYAHTETVFRGDPDWLYFVLFSVTSAIVYRSNTNKDIPVCTP